MTTRGFIEKVYATPSDHERRCSSVWADYRGNVYSYGRHYPLAFQVGGLDFVNCSGYSNTTSRHIGWAQQALGYDCIEVCLPHNRTWYPEDLTLEDMLKYLNLEHEDILRRMSEKKRHDTQVFKALEDELADCNARIELVKGAL